jgi:asparagine synthase (glutamine-hydrolysing)
MAARLRHRGREPHVFPLGDNGIVAVLDDRARPAWVETSGWQLAAHARHYSKNEEERAGHRIAARLLQALRAESWADLKAFNGHFAFVAWDTERKRLLLGRDYVGCFPLYYGVNGNGLLGFASEYKALLAMPGFVPVPDLDMVQHLQCTKKMPSQRTLLENVRSAPHGCVVSVDAAGRVVAQHAMPPPAVDIQYRTASAAKAPVLQHVEGAVAARTPGTEPIGIALSGGIDSIALACICRRLYPSRDIYTFTAGYGFDDPELTTAASVAKKMRTHHIEVLTPPQLIRQDVRELVWHLEDPIARSEALQLWALGKEARGKVRSVLAANGADGLFGGMPKHRILWLIEKIPSARRSFQEIYEYTQSGVMPRRAMAKAAVSLKLRKQFPRAPRVIGSAHEPKPASWPETADQMLNRFTSATFQNGSNQTGPKFERAFAAFGLDYSTPFFDPVLIDFAYTIDGGLKITRSQQKRILREALRDVVPSEFLQVPKLPQRMRYDVAFAAELDEACDELLSDDALRARGWFRLDDVHALKRARPDRPYRAEHAMRLWTLLLTEIWAQTFLDADGSMPTDSEVVERATRDRSEHAVA